MLSKRLLSSSILIILTWLTLYVFPQWVFGVIISLFIALALYEFFSMIENKGIIIYKYFGIIMGIIIPMAVFLKFEPATKELIFVLSSCLLIFILQFTRREVTQAIVSVSVTMLGLTYISWFLSFLIKVKFEGTQYLVFLLIVTKIGDVGAYFLGSVLGKHKLISRISPKKSIEGTIGGLIFSITAALYCGRFLVGFNVVHLLILGALLGGIAQIGDLSESLIKRDCQVKDSGKLFPGLGGVLDLMDSLLFTAPIFYLYLKLVV